MTFYTTRFGTLECSEDDLFVIPEGFLGFPQYTRFVVINHKPGSPFRWIQSVEEASLAFLVLDPQEVSGDYQPEINDLDARALGLDEHTPRQLYAVVSIPRGNPQAMTVNLAGPIVINAQKQIGRQVVIDDERWGTKHAVVSIQDQEDRKAAA